MKGIVLGIFLACITVFSGAQSYTDIKVSQLPKPAQDYIRQNIPANDVTRAVKVDDNGRISYGVVFQSRGQKHVLIFDKDGNFAGKGDKLMGEKGQVQVKQAQPETGTSLNQTDPPASGKATRVITTDKLPGKAQSYIKTTYPQGKIVSSSQFTDKSVVFYQASVREGTRTHVLTFNSKGNYLSKRYYYTMPGEQQKK